MGAVLVITAVVGGAVMARAQHFPEPTDTGPSSCSFAGAFRVNGQEAGIGDEVAFFNTRGVVRGRFVLSGSPGLYPFTAVYAGQETQTGDRLEVRVWDASAGVEYRGKRVKLAPGTLGGSTTPSPVPPVLGSDNENYALDIDTIPHVPGDLDADGNVDLADAVLGLRVLAGLDVQADAPAGVDVDADGRVGMGEVLYILRTMAGLGPG